MKKIFIISKLFDIKNKYKVIASSIEEAIDIVYDKNNLNDSNVFDVNIFDIESDYEIQEAIQVSVTNIDYSLFGGICTRIIKVVK